MSERRQKMNPRIGINPITWSNDDLQYVGGDISLETCLREASEAGYEGIELGHKFPRDHERLAPLLGAHKLELVSGWYSGMLLTRDARQEAEQLQAHVDLLEAMGCSVLIYAEVTGCIHSDPQARLSQRPHMPPREWPRFGKRLSELASMVSERGLKLCYHHHMGTVVQSREDVNALMDEVSEDVWLLLDSGHAAFAGADPVALARDHSGRIGHVHCKDTRPEVLKYSLNRDCSFLDAVLEGVFTVPGDGDLDFAGIFAELDRHGYAGWVVVEAEQDPSVARPAHYARLGFNNLEQLIRATDENRTSA
jgi:inosose dehydratase